MAKVSAGWHLNCIFWKINDSIKEEKGVLFKAVRRKANSMADYLANQGVTTQDRLVSLEWNSFESPKIKRVCTIININDLHKAGIIS